MMSESEIPPPPHTTAAPASRPGSVSRLLIGGGLGLAIGIIATALIMSSMIDQRVSDAVDDEQSRVAAQEASLAVETASAEARESERLAGLLGNAFAACDRPSGLRVTDGGRTLTFDMEGEDESTGASVDDIVCVLAGLDVPDSIVSNMDQTTAMDGRQTGEWADLEITWSYHPDRGLDGVITVAAE